jgi:membrane protease YdiL (CAAX protease family)
VTNRTRLVLWSSLVVLLIAVEYAGRLASGPPDRNVLYKYSTAAGSAVVYLFMLLLVVAIAGGSRSLLALRRPASWKRAAGLMAVLFVGIYIAVFALEQLLHGSREQGLTPDRWEPSHAGAYAANFVVIAIMAPIVEELMFRGLGYSLLAPFGVLPAILIVGVTFALAHGLLNAFPALAVFGCALAWLRMKTSSVYPGMIVHGTFNAVALVAAAAIH